MRHIAAPSTRSRDHAASHLKTAGADDIVRRVTEHRSQSRFLPWLLALVFLAVQAITFAHELKHDLHQHDDASCVLHLHTKHSSHVAAGVAWYAAHATCESSPSLDVTPARAASVRRYDTRAPPSPSSVSVA